MGVALRLPQVAHMGGAGAVGLLVTLRLAVPVQLRLPEDVGGGAASLCDAGGHQRLVAAVQQGARARRHVDLRLNWGGGARDNNEEVYKMNIDLLCMYINK